MSNPEQRPAQPQQSQQQHPIADAQRQAGREVAAKLEKNPVVAMMTSTGMLAQIRAALPRHMNADRMARVALTELRKNPDLMKCEPASFAGAIIQASQLGLEPGSGLGHAYLIPYGKECTMVIGYRGLIDLAMRSGNVLKMTARVVKEHDDFDYAYGLEERLDHQPAGPEKGLAKTTHAYAIAWLKGGQTQFEVMTVAEIEKVRDKASKGAKRPDSPWQVWFDEMARKTVIRKLAKHLPLSPELQTAFEHDAKTSATPMDAQALLQGLGDTIDAEASGA